MWKWTWEMWHKKCGMRNVVVCGVGHNIRCKAISHENHGGDPVWRCPRKVQEIFVELCCWYLWRCNAKCIVWVTQLKFVSSVHFVVVNNVCILTACILSFCILSPCHLSLYHLSVYHLSGYHYEYVHVFFEFQVQFSMLEIYNEQVRDLLNPKTISMTGGLKVRQDPKGGFYGE